MIVFVNSLQLKPSELKAAWWGLGEDGAEWFGHVDLPSVHSTQVDALDAISLVIIEESLVTPVLVDRNDVPRKYKEAYKAAQAIRAIQENAT